MGALFLISRALLAAVFALAGLSKVASIGRTRDSVTEFGVPATIAAPFAVTLIVAELAVAITLIPSATSWYGALGAVILLSLFSIAITVNLLRDHRPTCNCFGQLKSEPIGWPTLSRNVAFGAIGGVLVMEGRNAQPPSFFAWMRALDTATAVSIALAIVIFGVLIVIAGLLVQVLRQQGRMLLRFEVLERHFGIGAHEEAPAVGLPPGSPAPTFALPDLNGRSKSLGQLLEQNRPALIVFSNPGCGPCQALLPEIAEWQRAYRDEFSVALISEGSADANREKMAAIGAENVLMQHEREVAEAYRATATPAAVVISPGSRIASFVAQGGEAIRALVLAIGNHELPLLARPAPAEIAVGETAPELAFETLAGQKLALSDIRGESALLLFWNQHCGFCQRMLPDLKSWESNAPDRAPRVLVISSGSADDYRGFDLRSQVVLDRGSHAARAFGARGTPMAILLDREGRVASELAAGAEAVLALANRGVHPGGSDRLAEAVG